MDPALQGSLIEATATILTGIIAIILVIWQIRKSQDAVIKDSYSKLLEERRENIVRALEDNATRKMILRQFGLSQVPEDKEKLYLLIFLDIDHYQHVFFRYSRGLFPKELWPQWRNSMISSFQLEIYREIWESKFRDVVSQEFKKYHELGFPDI